MYEFIQLMKKVAVLCGKGLVLLIIGLRNLALSICILLGIHVNKDNKSITFIKDKAIRKIKPYIQTLIAVTNISDYNTSYFIVLNIVSVIILSSAKRGRFSVFGLFLLGYGFYVFNLKRLKEKVDLLEGLLFIATYIVATLIVIGLSFSINLYILGIKHWDLLSPLGYIIPLTINYMVHKNYLFPFIKKSVKTSLVKQLAKGLHM